MAALTVRLPVSDHCDGKRFFNPGSPAEARSLADVLRWRLAGGRSRWPTAIADPLFAPPPTAVAPDEAAVTFINHATFLLRFAAGVVLTDPVFSERCSPVAWAGPRRVRRPGLALSALPRPDLVLLSHNHYDHMDLASLRQIRQTHSPRFVTTLGNARTLASAGIEATELDWWETLEAGGLRITATPARHFSARTLLDRDRSLWAGFMIGTAGGKVLFAGDSGAGPHWADISQRLGPLALALLPVGAYEPRWFMQPVHMNPAEAVGAHLALAARHSIGMHFGTFQLTDEAIDAPLLALSEAIIAAGLGEGAFTTLGFGETRVVPLRVF